MNFGLPEKHSLIGMYGPEAVLGAGDDCTNCFSYCVSRSPVGDVLLLSTKFSGILRITVFNGEEVDEDFLVNVSSDFCC